MVKLLVVKSPAKNSRLTRNNLVIDRETGRIGFVNTVSRRGGRFKVQMQYGPEPAAYRRKDLVAVRDLPIPGRRNVLSAMRGKGELFVLP